MKNITLNPYLFFAGNCAEAMEFYKKIFGGRLKSQMYDDMPGGNTDEKMKGKVMHAYLKGDGIELLASDSTQASPETRKIELCLGGTDEPKLRKMFDELSQGGKIRSPLKKEFWGDTFGALTDKFGIDWMMNIAGKKE